MKRLAGLILLYLVSLNIGYTQSPEPAIYGIVNDFVNTYRVPGIAVGISTAEGDHLITIGHVGHDQDEALSAHTLFQIGEVSELFTSALMIDMYFKGMIDLYEPLSDYVPPYIEVPCFERVVYQLKSSSELVLPADMDAVPLFGGISCSAEIDTPIIPITFCRLATHHSGLPAYPEKMQKLYLTEKTRKAKHFPPYMSESDLYQLFCNQSLIFRPGTSYHYSNMGFAILGHLLGYQEGLSYEQLLYKRIVKPLDLTYTCANPHAFSEASLLTAYRQVDPPKYSSPAFAPAQGLQSTPSDMLKFLSASLGHSHIGPLTSVLEEIQVPHGEILHSDFKELRTGYGWWVQPIQQGKKYRTWKEGYTQENACFIGLIPERGVGVVVMVNTSLPLRKLGFDLLALLDQHLSQKQQEEESVSNLKG